MTQANGRALHRAAMERMDEHDRLVRAGSTAEARLHALDALQLEKRALDVSPAEPFRSLVYRSAASIALESGLPDEALALIGEALSADDVPDAVSEQLKELGRAARQRSHVPESQAMWHRLRIFATHTSDVTMGAASRALGAWLDYLKAAVVARTRDDEQSRRVPALSFLPAVVTNGSFVAGMDVVASPTDQSCLTTIVADLRDALREGRMPPHIELRAWLDVLDILAQNSLGLEAVLTPPRGEPVLFVADAATISMQRNLVSSAATNKLFSSEVPQANDLQRVFQLLELTKHARGRPDTSAFGLTPRQLNYYRNAAEVLRFLSPGHEWKITDAGERVVVLSRDQRLSFTAVEFEATRVGRAWIDWSEANTLCDVNPESATEFVRATVVDLSRTTVPRRAQTLATWARALIPHHYAYVETE